MQCVKAYLYHRHLQRCEPVTTRANPCECIQYDGAFARNNYHQIHKSMHTGSFVSYSGLRIHRRTYSGEKVYDGNQCDKVFAHHSNLQKHKRTLSGEKPYECNQCGKTFAFHSHFQIHKRIHTGEKPY